MAKAFASRKDMDMTTGNLFWKIILFALPIMATTAMQLLYTTVDLTTVHYGAPTEAMGEESMGAIASNNALINLIVVVFTGVSLGVNVILSEAKGAGDKEKASKVMHTSMILALFSGIFVGLLGFFISDDLLRLMGTEAHYMEKATLYLRIYFGGLPFLMLYNYEAQMLRAQGDSRTPFLILVASGLTNIAFDCLFVFPLQMDVAGVGAATVMAEGVSCILGFLALWKGKNNFVSFRFKELRLDRACLLEVLRVGLPAGLQGFFFSLPNVFIQSSLYTIDPGNVNLENGATAASGVEGYFHAMSDAIAVSMMTFIAGNVGAKKPENVKKCILYGFAWGGIVCSLIALITGALHYPLLRLFVSNEEAIEAGRSRLFTMGFFYSFQFLMGATAGALRGIRKSTFPMVTTLVFCTGLRILLILTVFPLEQFHTVMWLYALFPITWALSAGVNLIGMAIFFPKTMRKISTTEAVTSTENESSPCADGADE
ncbi:MAG: MATE family efflux transporter [Bacilli bacterium]|nr:MATE family efflux transporter [Bacilli bacterium]